MITSELIKPQHLARKALIYIRQSSPNQVVSNQESLKLQYALKQRAIELGWLESKIDIIDADLGITGASIEDRQGFKNLVTEVTLDKVGIILSYEVTRLSRNCSDWYPLLDICGLRSCLIGDRDGIYDSSTPNGRLLLGLKGQLSEMELHTLKGRLTAGLLNKAKRGELALRLPIGLTRNERGLVQKDPNLEVQSRIEMIFATFLKLKSAAQVLKHFNTEDIKIPRRDQFDEVIWKKPTIAAILSTLKNPAYAGAFVYGRTRTSKTCAQKQLPQEEWKIKVNDKYPTYTDWETWQKVQKMIKDNHAEYDRNKSRGIPRPGKALLHGITYCGECGHKMVVQYKNSTRYICNYLRQQYGVPVCQFIPADPIDDYVVSAFFEALSPIELNAYAKTVEAQQVTNKTLAKARLQQLQRLRYQANLAERQFRRVDPDNRLVADELERQWETALQDLKQAEKEIERDNNPLNQAEQITPQMKKQFEDIGKNLPSLWRQQLIAQPKKKALLRCLIDKVVIHRATRDHVQTRIVWRGGATVTVDIPITVGSFGELSTAKQMEEKIIALARSGKADEEIAQELTNEGHRSPMRARVLRSTVQIIRLKHRILRNRHQSHPRRISGYLTVPQLAKMLYVDAHWIYDRIHNGDIRVTKDKSTRLFLFPNKPKTIKMFKEFKNGNLKSLNF